MENLDISRQEIIDKDQINILSIFYFVYGGIVLLVSLIVSIYFFFFSAFLLPLLESIKTAPEMENFPFSIIMYVFGTIFFLLVIYGALLIFAGIKMRKYSGRILTIVLGCLALLSFPLGTALGVFTLIVLTRASVAKLFDRNKYEAIL